MRTTPVSTFLLLVFLCLNVSFADAQKRPVRRVAKPAAAKKAPEIGRTVVVFDENLSALREKPSIYSTVSQRMRVGRKVKILETANNDGITYFRIEALPDITGWIQSEAVLGKFRNGDEERFARLIYASTGFEQIELTAMFFELYTASKYRAPLLLLYGDLIETAAIKLSRDASKRINSREIAATGAPLHSYFLNFVSLDRYRRLGIVFRFDPMTRSYHYDGASWREIVEKFPTSKEAEDAQIRIDSLKEKMSK